jgi:hypothetical protein
MKLTNQDLDILRELLEDKLKKINNGPEGIEIHQRPEVYINIIKKIDGLYFS